MIISFIGHSTIHTNIDIKSCVKSLLDKYANINDSITCYLGGYGDFDELCAIACKEFKENHPNLELVYITPYITLLEQSKIKDMIKAGKYDSSMYPPIENTPPRFAIAKRNEWMMKSADIVVAYVNRTYGGAYKALLTAKRLNKTIINIGKTYM